MVNQQILEGRWNELAGYIKSKWGELTDGELKEAQGNLQQLVGLIQTKTGWAKENIEAELEKWVDRGKQFASRATATARTYADDAGDRGHYGYEEVEHLIERRPMESAAVAFGSGLIAGVIIGLVIRRR